MQRSHRYLFFCLALLLLPALVCAAAPEMVPMTGGVKLATDVHQPEGTGPWPVILVRSTYGRDAKTAQEYLKRGYAVVIQDTRGFGQSEGEKHVFYADGWRPDQHDGADTVAWIKAQAWCNGKIGTVGGSALAITQALMAPSTPGLSAQFMDAVPAEFYGQVSYQGGVFRKAMMEGWLTAVQQPHMIEYFRGHPTYDEYWNYYNTVAQAKNVNVPGLFVGGWQDIFAQGTIDGFLAREAAAQAPSKGQNRLIMKWSTHGPDVSKDYKLNENRFDLKVSQVRHAFLEAHLKGDTSAAAAFAKVNYYVMGGDEPGAPGNEWRTAETWPPYATTATPFYLHADQTLSGDARGSQDAKLAYVFDPANPVRTHGGANLLLPAGPFDQRKTLEGRQDILRFVTEALAAPMEITGRVSVKLAISSDAPDTDFTAKLVDVFPDGREILLLDSVRRVKTRDSFETVAPLLTGPDQVVEVEIDLWSIAWIFNTGHRIGLHVSSSNHPRFEVNPNTGADFQAPGGEWRKATNTVHMSALHPSALVLPVRPAAH